MHGQWAHMIWCLLIRSDNDVACWWWLVALCEFGDSLASFVLAFLSMYVNGLWVPSNPCTWATPLLYTGSSNTIAIILLFLSPPFHSWCYVHNLLAQMHFRLDLRHQNCRRSNWEIVFFCDHTCPSQLCQQRKLKWTTYFRPIVQSHHILCLFDVCS